jgi:hydroxymethylpyrimidine/phosphomethylpyrimidine kinase
VGSPSKLSDRPVVLSIAGFDPSSGAGITADLKVIASHGCFGVSAITALTVQSTRGVAAVQPVPAPTLAFTLDELASDFEIAAVKVGMLATAEVAKAVADFLEARKPQNVVLDPIILSSSGSELLDTAGVEILKARLLRAADLVTPNITEALALTSLPVGNPEEAFAAARRLQKMGARTVVITGGHLADNSDFLLTESGGEHVFAGPKLSSQSTHGTGCAFATSIACGLAKGLTLSAAVKQAKDFVRQAIEAAEPIGTGPHKPINHLFRSK